MNAVSSPASASLPTANINPFEALRKSGPQRFAELMKFLRDRPLVRVAIGPMKTYLTGDAEVARYVLQENHLNYEKGPNIAELKHFLGEGLFTSEGDFWKRQRRLAQPAFHRQQLATLTGTMARCTERMLERWEEFAASGEPFDLAHEMMKLTLTTVGEALFHYDLDSGASEMGAALTVVLDAMNRRVMFPLRVPMRIPTPGNVRFKRALRILDTHVGRIISDRRAAKERPHDLLSMFLDVRDADSGEGMSDHQIRDEVMTLVLAGHETTANALSWAFHLLSTHPEAEARLRAELDTVLGGRTPVFEDLPKLTYTLNVFQEAMRLYPPVWMMERTNKTADVLAGVRVPARSIISISPYAVHHNPRVWEDPEAFDPDRFLPERAKDRPRFAYMPFGGGPRLCIGNNFALMEAQLILAMVLQRHRPQLDPTGVVEPALVLTLRPRFGITMTLKPPRAATLGRSQVVA